MDAEEYSVGPCPIGRALLHVGDAWSMLILRNASLGTTRFDAFRKSLGIAPNILTKRLAALTESGLLERRRYSARPPREEYVLTAKGRDFLPILHAIGEWGRRHHGEGTLSHFVDAQTGCLIEPVVIDRRSGEPIGSRPLQWIMPDQAGA